MTPLYDVMSAWSIVARKELHLKQMKMAMSVDGVPVDRCRADL